MTLDYAALTAQLVGQQVPEPLSGTTSGHAAGEPFDKHVYALLKQQQPGAVFRQYEFLNDLYRRAPHVISVQDRQQLFDSPTLHFLLSRGKDATAGWSESAPFEEKQNDTADILVVDRATDFFHIIDVKTRNLSKKAQPPNIISAYKLAQMCAKLIDNQDYDRFGITYIGLDWRLNGGYLQCAAAYVMYLFRASPDSLYINWAAALQIQTHVEEMDQTFTGTVEEWARAYLRNFVTQAQRRMGEMEKKFVQPFQKYLLPASAE